jgi:hypothetical protein
MISCRTDESVRRARTKRARTIAPLKKRVCHEENSNSFVGANGCSPEEGEALSQTQGPLRGETKDRVRKIGLRRAGKENRVNKSGFCLIKEVSQEISLKERGTGKG